MPLASSGASSATGTLSVVVNANSMEMLFGRHVGPDPTELGNKLGVWEQGLNKEDSAVEVELETPFLLVVYPVGGV